MNAQVDQKSKPIASGHSSNQRLKEILLWPVRFLKFIKRFIFRLITLFADAGYDLYRFLRYSNALNIDSKDRQKLESLLFFYYHKIEKALALPTVKPLFGIGYIEITLDLAQKWARETNDLNAVVFRGAYSALQQYQKHVEQALSEAHPSIAIALNRFLTDYSQPNRNLSEGGTFTYSRGEMQKACREMDLNQFISQRRSIRNFTDQHVPDSILIDAVRMAQHSPSVCNRQCWRVHVFTSCADKAKILQHQNGNAGFGHLADRVLLITADLRAFLFSGERNQAYTDTGMFAMTLLYALQSHGVASCCLNLDQSFKEDLALRRASQIPRAEVPVMLILIGYPPESMEVAISARVSTENILSFRNLS